MDAPPASPRALLAHALEDRRALVAVLVLVAGAFAGAAGAGWYWDDARLIVANPVVRNVDLSAAFGHHLWWGVAPDPAGLAYWRPLLLVSLFLDRLAAPDSPGFAHLHSVAWHLLVVTLVYALARPRIGGARAVAAALFAGLHPAVSGAVLWVSARNDVLCAAALLGALLAADREKPMAVAVLAATAAMCKEVGFAAPIVVIGWQAAWGRPSRAAVLGAAFGSGAALVLRGLADVPAAAWHPDLRSAGVAATFGLAQLAAPWPLAGVVWLPAHTAWTFLPGAVLGVALLAALVRDAPRRAGPLVALALLLWAPTLAASAGTSRAGEWYLYVPLVVLAVPLAAALRPWMAAPAAALGLAALVVIGLRIGEWTDDESLTRATLARAPTSRDWARLGSVLEAQGRVDEALDAYTRGLTETPTFTNACASPARMLRRAGREADARGFAARFPCAEAGLAP